MFMKKVLAVILPIMMIFAFIACVGGEEDTYVVPKKEHTYVVSKDNCYSIFGRSPKAAVDGISLFPWIEDNYVSMEVDKDENLVIVLSDMHVERWKTEIVKKFEEANKSNSEYRKGIGFQFNETYTEMEYYIDRGMYISAGLQIGALYQHCGIMQMLKGEDLNGWHVNIKAIDIDTGITIKEGRLPDDKIFDVEKADWEKAMGKAD